MRRGEPSSTFHVASWLHGQVNLRLEELGMASSAPGTDLVPASNSVRTELSLTAGENFFKKVLTRFATAVAKDPGASHASRSPASSSRVVSDPDENDSREDRARDRSRRHDVWRQKTSCYEGS